MELTGSNGLPDVHKMMLRTLIYETFQAAVWSSGGFSMSSSGSGHYGIRLVSRYLIWDSMICRKIQSVSVAAEEFTTNRYRYLYLPTYISTYLSCLFSGPDKF